MAEDIISSELDSLESTEIAEDLDEVSEDVDELVTRLDTIGALSETRHTQIVKELEACKTMLSKLSTGETQAENPLLTQLLNQLIEIRADLVRQESTLRKLEEATTRVRERKDSSPPLDTTQTEDVPDPTPDNRVENADPTSARKNRFI